jgi:DNA-binding transcriptional ArsR family regulator
MMRTVTAQPDIAAAAALFGDPARVAMLTALLDSPVLTAGELAFAANISPQTASFHLAKLTSAGLVVGARQGRNHMYRLAGPAVASAIESLAAVSPTSVPDPPPTERFHSERMRQLRAARTCYDHLAGIAGVLLHDCLLRRGYLESNGSKEYVLAAKGRGWFSEVGIPAELLRSKSPFARQCMDWSEKRPHLAGRLAAFLLDQFFADRWIARIRDSRAVRITERGVRELERQYGLHLQDGWRLPAGKSL